MLEQRLADTSVPLHPPLAARWSPRVFDSEAILTGEEVVALLEAARWSATWGGRQPVRFLVGLRIRTRDGEPEPDATFTALAGVLKRGNSYAHAAGALVLVCADEGPDEKTAFYAAVDAGAAIANATVEAVSRGLVAHPMAGFDADAARATFDIPADVRPVAVVAFGSLGDYASAAADLVERDAKPRDRLPLREIAYAGRWGSPARL